jgi:hypothetical protein
MNRTLRENAGALEGHHCLKAAQLDWLLTLADNVAHIAFLLSPSGADVSTILSARITAAIDDRYDLLDQSLNFHATVQDLNSCIRIGAALKEFSYAFKVGAALLLHCIR